MSFFGLLTLLVLGISLLIFVIGCFIEDIDMSATVACISGLIFVSYLIIGVIVYGKHDMNADYYKALLNEAVMLENRIKENNIESIDVYNKDLNKVNKQIERQRKAMSVKDWESYYKSYGDSN